jgi:hypothetical protein
VEEKENAEPPTTTVDQKPNGNLSQKSEYFVKI